MFLKKTFISGAALLFFVVVALFPLISFAATVPFGGIITSPVIPCLGSPAYAVKVTGFVAGVPKLFLVIYKPGLSKTYLFGPPKNPGQFLLGSSIPGTCNGVPGLMIDAFPGVGSSLK
ncbi:MAG: hypothetical protein AAB439_00380 [Patescibacteria group bacterium]